jgi:hypothetical protein
VECAGWSGTAETSKTRPQTSWLGPSDTGRIKAGKAPGLLSPANDFSPAVGLTMRFDGASSITCRIACRSSVAETTGNSSIKTQPRRRNGRMRSKPRRSLVQSDSWHQIQTAGTAKVSQKRLRTNSICSPQQLNRNNQGSRMVRSSVCEEISLAKYGIQVNVNARACTLGWMDARPQLAEVSFTEPCGCCHRKPSVIPSAAEEPCVLPMRAEKQATRGYFARKLRQPPK